MAEIYNISDWNYKNWIGTGGTRDKNFVENPADGKVYFFKESIERYPSEFWSEIISSKIGKHLGFDVLDYNTGIVGVTLGCICESMIDQTSEELEHGINLLKEKIPNFKLTDRPKIGFDQVELSLENYNGFINKFIEMLVFDAIIGNQDRHSENWAIIRSLDVESIDINKKKLIQRILNMYRKYDLRLDSMPFKRFFMKYMNKAELVNTRFAPIYDSGSSLGRDIDETRIDEYLSTDSKIRKYIDKGKSEIRWTEKEDKINHFEIIEKVKQKHHQKVIDTINNVLKIYKKEDIKNIINNIDNKASENIKETKLSLQRKELIIKFIDLRIERLKEILK